MATERRRRSSSLVLAALAAPAAVVLAAGADVHRDADTDELVPVAAPVAPPVVEEAPPCCLEIMPASRASARADLNVASGQLVSVANWRAAAPSPVHQALPAGIAPERGLQVKTILTARNISVVFPEIQQIGGVRADPLRWHPNGLALDVMIPNPNSAAGIALGNQIVAYVLKNAERFGMQDAIWRGVYYTPNGARATGGGVSDHGDHVHITTTGGGYPSGDEVYFR
ncbi:hypothetical protein E4P42_22795 [Mycobacterium sp. PS03-16]|nr:hypothetical protein E4P42_22795 [Mycobacterium sp. PS03-16]